MTNSKRKVGAPAAVEEMLSGDPVALQTLFSDTQLSVLFEVSLREVRTALRGNVKPCAEERGRPVYALADAAPYIVKPARDKDFWATMRSQQLFEKENAELWRTEHVVDVISALLKTLRMNLLMTREAVERETELADRQRAIVTRIIDNALEGCYVSVNNLFAHRGSVESFSEERTGSEDL